MAAHRFLKQLFAVFFCVTGTLGAARPGYQELVAKVKSGDLSIDFRELRLACLKAKTCDPRGDDKDLADLRQATQELRFDRVANIAEELLERGFVNIRAHLACEEAYAALHDTAKASFHHRVAAALIDSILHSGDGNSEDTAYQVIDVSEEYLIVNALHLARPHSQALVVNKNHHYDRLDTNDPKMGALRSVYFNIDAFYSKDH
jgi:hypothetical protein